ncbi:hypothetical protein ACQUQP_14930 [Marinobacterium sp. YM272]|uniref:hypothetical protein n=1 Tax=Marinobacterium sp. YM272 TaxID=3421654 RepID=UPI003D7F3502
MTDQNSESPGRLRLILSLLVTACVAVFVIAILPRLLEPAEQAAIVLTPPACDIAEQRCVIQDRGIKLAFALSPTPLHSATPLTAMLEIEGIPVRRVILSLEGRDMYMGINETELRPSGSNLWQGKTELAVCTTGQMVWRAALLIEADDAIYKTWFDFEAR